MKAVACRHAELSVVEREAPVPGKGQLLIEVTRAGICGSDLHARRHCDELADVMVETGYDDFMRSDQPVIFGHEFIGTDRRARAGLPQDGAGRERPLLRCR